MLCCLLGARAGPRLIPRDRGRFRIVEHGSEPGAKHGVGGKRANHRRPILDPDGVSNEGRLRLRRSLRESESTTREAVPIGLRHEFSMPQVLVQVAELAEANSSLTVTQTSFVLSGPLTPPLLQGGWTR